MKTPLYWSLSVVSSAKSICRKRGAATEQPSNATILMQYYTHIELLRVSPTYRCVLRVNLDEATEGIFEKRVYNTMQLLNIENLAVSQIEFSNAQIWNVSSKILCDNYVCGRRRDVGADEGHVCGEHQEIFHSQAIHLHTDGSKSGGETGCVSQMHSISHKLSEH